MGILILTGKRAVIDSISKAEGMAFVVRILLQGDCFALRPSYRNDGASVEVWAFMLFQAELFLLLPQKNNIYIRLFRIYPSNTNT